MRRYSTVVVAAATLGAAGCGFRVLDRWDGHTVRSAHVDAPADSVWSEVVSRLDQLELPVASLEPETHSVALSWVTAPGDGAQYLDCAGSMPVGSASVMPRILVEPLPGGGSRVEVSSVVRATSGQSCRSNGRYEAWLLSRVTPASEDVEVAGGADASARNR